MLKISFTNIDSKRIKVYFSYLIIVVNLLFLFIFIAYKYRYLYQSDAAIKMILASEILKQGTIIPSDWYYANGDVWIFFLQLPLILLEKIFGYGWKSYTLNSIIYLSIYAWSVYYFLKTLKIDLLSKTLLFILAFSALSKVNADMFFGQLAGITIPIFLFTVLGVLFSSEEHGRKTGYWIMAILIFSYTITNPVRVIVYYLSPVLLVVFLLYLDKKDKKYLNLIGVILASFFVSALIYYLLIKPNVAINFDGASTLNFSNYAQILDNISLFFLGFFSYFNLVGPWGAAVKSINGLLAFSHVLFAILLIVAIKRKMQIRLEEITLVNIVSILFLYYGLIIGYLYIFTEPLAQNDTTFRYFRPLFYLGMILLVLYIQEFRTRLKSVTVVALLLFLTLSNFKNYYIPYDSNYVKRFQVQYGDVAKYIVDHNLSYGFASFWNAGVTMSLTENRALIAPIEMDKFIPRRWLSAENWYRDYQKKKSFLMLGANEYKQQYPKIEQLIPRKPVETVFVGGFVLLLYDYNLASYLNRIESSELKEKSAPESKNSR